MTASIQTSWAHDKQQDLLDIKVTAFLWAEKTPRAFTETLVSLLNMDHISRIIVGICESSNADLIEIRDPRIEFLFSDTFGAAAKVVCEGDQDFLLCVTSPVKASSNAIQLAAKWMSEDPRIATVSFLSNAGGYLSFPHRNTPTPFCVDGHDESTLTLLLRGDEPGELRPVPLPVAEGAMVLLSMSLVAVCGALKDDRTGSYSFSLADLSLRGSRRGFNNYLDCYTFITVPFDGVGKYESVLENPEARHALYQRHHFFPAVHDLQRDRSDSLLGQSLDYARAKAQGLRILIDGSILGPKEMGTQTLVVNLTKALAKRSDVQWVALGVPDPLNLPAYAHELVATRKVRIVPAGNSDFPEGPVGDIVHRPYQPSGVLPWERWSGIAKRSVITVQDLIAFKNPSYFAEWVEWDLYREQFKAQIARCDGVFSISNDVVKVIREERLPVDDQRIFVVENGADARSKEHPTCVPSEVLRRGWGSSPFLLVLGAAYAHKNRDTAIKVWKALRDRGFRHKLVFAGSAVPYGSTRVEEAIEAHHESASDMLILPDVSSEERNWLLANSELVVYLTSAEGFGLVPFEAARMEVPTLFVSFGPLRELIDDTSLPKTYDINGLVERASELLTDPHVARESIRKTLVNLGSLNWEETARKSVEAYYELLKTSTRLQRS